MKCVSGSLLICCLISSRLFASVASRALPENTSQTNEHKEEDDYVPNPEEEANFYEGDMIIGKATFRNGIISPEGKWKDGIVPIEITDDFDQNDLAHIREALETIQNKTCIRYRRKRDTDRDYVLLQGSKKGCFSHVGRQGGKQVVNVMTHACTKKAGVIMHELMHTLGFHHEQSREDRDEYVEVKWENIMKGMQNNFSKSKIGETTAFGYPYDYDSILHYNEYAFTKNKKKTIVPKQRTGIVLGQRSHLSEIDAGKINAMYKCHNRK